MRYLLVTTDQYRGHEAHDHSSIEICDVVLQDRVEHTPTRFTIGWVILDLNTLSTVCKGTVQGIKE